jgi:chromosome segregation ATPase
MTIAANLSRKLYDTLGDEAAEAMVDWMQRVDTQRSELRELNDLSFARIDSRFAEAEARLDARFTAAEARLNARFAEVDAKFGARFAQVDARFEQLSAKMDARFADVNAKIDLRTATLDGRIDTLRAELGQAIATRYGDLLKWSFVFWATAMIALFLRTR